MSRLALVTGVSGFVGSAVAKALVQDGWRVRALVRPTSPRGHLKGLPLEFAEGDLRNPAALAQAMAGVTHLFHVAADYRLWARNPRVLWDANVAGTLHVMEAAAAAGVERIVHTSSVATLAPRMDGVPVDETARLDEANAIGDYKRSKVAAEREVERLIREHDLPAVIVQPSTPIGPRDVKPTPTGRIIVECASGRVPGFVDTGLNLVHVDDVAAGHLAAMEKGRIGERYILGGQDVLLSDMLADIAAIAQRRAPRLRFPHAAIMPIAYMAEGLATLTGREPFVTRDGLRMARYRMFYSAAKAERELGFRARPYREALVDAVEWFRREKYL